MEQNKTLESFKEIRGKLLADYKTREQELAAIRKELVAVGILQDENVVEQTLARAKPVMRGAGPIKKRGARSGGWTDKIVAAVPAKAKLTAAEIKAKVPGYEGNFNAALNSIAKSGTRLVKHGSGANATFSLPNK